MPCLCETPDDLSQRPSGQPKPDLISSGELELLSITFNQDYGCFTAGTNCGLRVYCSDPFREVFRREARGVGFIIVEMLFRCHLLALVGDGTNPHYPPNKVFIWDDLKNCAIAEFAFRSQVCGVKLRQNCMAVIVEHKIFLYKLENLRLFYQMDTLANPRGLCCLSHDPNNFVLACPGFHLGHVRIEHFGLNVTKLICAHESQIACLALTLDGLLLATASTRGTLIRIFSTVDGTCLQEVRRGADKADIYSIAFCPTAQWLAVSSIKGTVHVFKLRVQVAGQEPADMPRDNRGFSLRSSLTHVWKSWKIDSNTRSSLSFVKGLLPKYFSSEWSFAQFHLPEDTHYVTAFGVHNSVVILGMNGSYYKCIFDPEKGGEMLQQEYIQFMKVELSRDLLKMFEDGSAICEIRRCIYDKLR